MNFRIFRHRRLTTTPAIVTFGNFMDVRDEVASFGSVATTARRASSATRHVTLLEAHVMSETPALRLLAHFYCILPGFGPRQL